MPRLAEPSTTPRPVRLVVVDLETQESLRPRSFDSHPSLTGPRRLRSPDWPPPGGRRHHAQTTAPTSAATASAPKATGPIDQILTVVTARLFTLPDATGAAALSPPDMCPHRLAPLIPAAFRYPHVGAHETFVEGDIAA